MKTNAKIDAQKTFTAKASNATETVQVVLDGNLPPVKLYDDPRAIADEWCRLYVEDEEGERQSVIIRVADILTAADLVRSVMNEVGDPREHCMTHGLVKKEGWGDDACKRCVEERAAAVRAEAALKPLEVVAAENERLTPPATPVEV